LLIRARVILGIITDRDICVAVGTKDRRPSGLVAEKVMSRQVATCRTVDEIHVSIKIMRTRKVRRLPVVNEAGKLEGILCMSDLILDARHHDGTSPSLSYEDGMGALQRHLLPSLSRWRCGRLSAMRAPRYPVGGPMVGRGRHCRCRNIMPPTSASHGTSMEMLDHHRMKALIRFWTNSYRSMR